MQIRYTLILLSLLLLSGMAHSQTESGRTDSSGIGSSIYRFTVERDILNLPYDGARKITVTSISGVEEDVNKALWSATVITGEQIENSGAVTIAEALRLAPGVLVRQKTNGLYEVDINGVETLPVAGSLDETLGRMVLVMIDNMPVNSRFNGGVLWETLPVSIGDVERLEIIRNPSAVFNGYNAAAGIINIITKKPENNKISVRGNIQVGTSETAANHASLSFGARDKFFARLSGKYISTRRFQDEFYVFSEGRYIEDDSLLFYQSSAEKTNLYGTLARQDYAFNSFFQYKPHEKINFRISFSNQNSEGQNIYGAFEELAFTRRISSFSLANLNAAVHNFHLQASYTFGKQDMAVGYPGHEFDANSIHSRAYYDFIVKEIITFTPGVNYYQTEFSDSKYPSGSEAYPNVFQGSRRLSNYGLFLRVKADLLKDKVNLDGGIRKDYYSFNDQSILNYQVAAGYHPFTKVLLRVSYATGNWDNYALDAFDGRTFNPSDGTTFRRIINKDLKLSTAEQFEAGTRVNVTDKILVGFCYFRTIVSDQVQDHIFTEPNGTATSQRINSSIKLRRNGFTSDIATQLSGKLTLRVFGTVQNTNFANDTSAYKGNYTPRYFGGFTANYSAFLDKLNIGLSAYTYGRHKIQTDKGSEEISSKLIPAIKISYKIWQESSLFFNARNFLNANSKEFIFSDEIPALYLIGVSLNF